MSNIQIKIADQLIIGDVIAFKGTVLHLDKQLFVSVKYVEGGRDLFHPSEQLTVVGNKLKEWEANLNQLTK